MTEGFFKAIVRNCSDIISILDKDGNYLFVSDSVKSTLGYAPDELVGKNIFDYIYSGHLSFSYKMLRSVLNGEQESGVQVKFLSKKDGWKWMEATITNMLDEEQVKGIVINSRDVSERVNAEFIGRESQEMYKSLFENHPDAVFSLSPEGCFRSVNNGALKIFGYARQQMMDVDFCSFIDASNMQIAKYAFAKALEGKIQVGDIKVITKSGSIKELSVTLYPVKSSGTLEGVHGIAKDNTLLKRADRLAEENSKRLNRTLESITEGFFSLDKNHCFSYINTVGSKNIQKSIEEIAGKKFFSIFPNLKNTAFEKNYKEVCESKAVSRFEDVWPATGAIFSYNMYKREDGVAIFFIDVTEQKKAREELEKLSLVASKSSSAVLIMDKYGKIEWVNESFEKISGFSRDEVTGKRHGEVLFGEETNKESVKRIVDKSIKALSFSEEILLYNKKGERIWMTIDGTPVFDKSGALSKYVYIENNITARKMAEQELLLAKEQAEFAAQAKTQFLSVMSHEIRTPMNAVIGFTNLLLEQSPREDQFEHLKILQFSAENLLVLINDILDFNKIESGKIEFEKITFDLYELVANVKAGLNKKAEEKNILLELVIDPNLPKVTGDPVRVGQVFTNLISNAVKFTEKGKVSVSATIQKNDNVNATIDFAVTDTGIGIPENKHEAIFETFTQANSDTTRKFGGTGLGLTITKRILELLGTTIQLKSAPGKGSTFYFSLTFPVSNSKPVKTLYNVAPSYLQSHSSIKLLVAEDNEINILLIKLFLEQWKFDYDIAMNGVEAVEMVKKNDYDIVLMDLQMPDMDGYEATAAIRALKGYKYQKLPIIALTASAMLDIKDKAFDAGMNDYVSKPFKPEELYSKIVSNSGMANKKEIAFE